MASPTTRRALLGASAAACAGLSGCSALSFGGGEPDPDAGRDSYGVLLENRLEKTYTVNLRGETFLEHEVVFEETVDVAAGEKREWEQVFTEKTHYKLVASVEDEEFPEEYRTNSNSVNVGKESSSKAENVAVLLSLFGHPDYDEKVPAVWVTPPRE